MSTCREIIEPILKGSTISGDISSSTESLENLDFFLLFYVDRRRPIRIDKGDMILTEAGAYNWVIESERTKVMDAGQYYGEVCLVNGGVLIKKYKAFVLGESESAKQL